MKPDEIDTLEEFAAELMRLRRLSGLTLPQIVEEAGAGISTSTITNMCTGITLPTPYHLRTFLLAIGIEGEAEHEAWQRTRARLAPMRHRKYVLALEAEPPADASLHEKLDRIEAMLVELAREWGIGKRDV